MTKVDYCRTLHLSRMVKQGIIKPQALTTGSWVWTDRETGEQLASISYEANTLNYNSYLRVHYVVGAKKKPMDYKIPLVVTSPHYGGNRFWFKCPHNGRKTTKLYLPYGGDIFASRQAYRLKYASQSQGREDRAINKKWKIVRKTAGDDYPVRSKGMHHVTFEKILDKYWKQEELCEELLASKLATLLKLFGKL